MSEWKHSLSVASLLTLCVCGSIVLSLASALAEEKPQKRSDKDISDLIRQLGDEQFSAREEAHKRLLQIGKPAVEALRLAVDKTKDPEVRRRAREIVDRIDPGGERRRDLEKQRTILRKAIEEMRGVDVKSWAESIANPFSELTEEGKKRLTAEGIDVARLQKMRARYLQGSYAGAHSKTFVNTDPDTIVIVGKGFCAHEGLYSAGPVLGVENAYFMSHVKVANLVWFVDRAGASGGVMGVPVVAAFGAGVHARHATPGILIGDYGWRRPKNFLRPPSPAEAKNDPPAVKELANAHKELAEKVKKARAADVTRFAKAITNPFTALTEEGKTKLKRRGIQVDRLPKLKAVYLTGNYCGAASKDFVNNDPDTVLVIGKGFNSHGQIYSLGPILAVDNAGFRGVTGADIVWFTGQSCSSGRMVGVPVILDLTAGRSARNILYKHVWHGDYGWRAPKDFPGEPKKNVEK